MGNKDKDKKKDEEKTLCKIKDDIELLKKLVKDARYICKKCGRAARNEENLCKATKL
jgi:hypothetical protein